METFALKHLLHVSVLMTVKGLIIKRVAINDTNADIVMPSHKVPKEPVSVMSTSDMRFPGEGAVKPKSVVS